MPDTIAALSDESALLLLIAQNRIFVALVLAPSAAGADESLASDVLPGTSIAAAVAGFWLGGVVGR